MQVARKRNLGRQRATVSFAPRTAWQLRRRSFVAADVSRLVAR